MRHPNTRTLFAYWESRRSGRLAPNRSDIAPRDLAGLLAHLFILKRVDRDHHLFRLAGTAICDLHRREFKDQNFLSLWRGSDREHMRALIEGVLSAPGPSTAMADAISIDGRSAEVEITLLPLRGPEGMVDRCLGLYQPLSLSRLGGRPVVRQMLRELRPAVAPEPALSLTRAFQPTSRLARAANDL
ncbi:MAG: PAS domain-containing protein [Pseudomonadota bacterium]